MNKLPSNLLYIHGFNSSPESQKAMLVKAFIKKHYPEVNIYCPQVATSSNKAMAELMEIIDNNPGNWCLVGSSLGGYMSTYLSNRYKIPAVLINPAVKPYELLSDYIGWQTQPYTNERYEITSADMDALKSFDVEQIKPQNRLLVMVQTGDEVLDYRQAVEKYQECQLIVEQGGDHSFIDFDTKLQTIADFLQL